MPQISSPYDREAGFLEANIELAAALALIFSIGLHLLLVWVFFFLFPSLMTNRRDLANEVITVQLMGSLAPPAPAAPASLPVNPDLKGPDVVENPRVDPTPAVTQPAFPPAPEAVVAPADVIPLGPKAPEKPPEIKKRTTPPPKPTPPKVETEAPKPKPKQPSAEAELKKAMAEVERKVAAQNSDDDDVDARYVNRNLAQGRGDGQSSEPSGGNSGGRRLPPEMERYFTHIRDIVHDNWVPPMGLTAASTLQADFRVVIQPDGHVSVSQLVKSSGNSEFDITVERAINKSQFPSLPAIFEGKAADATFGFNSRDLQRSH